MPAAYAHLDEPAEPPRARVERRHRRLFVALGYLLLAAAVLVVGRWARAADADQIVVPEVAAQHPVRQSRAAAPVQSRAAKPVQAGTSGKFRVVTGRGRVLGTAGPIRTYRVGVEKPISAAAAAAFAGQVDRVLGDRQGWVASRRLRLQRVPISARADFTIFLASARTSQRLCRAGGMETRGYTSCRLPGKVIINDDRWREAVRGYGAPLATYRRYVINHEVGHQLGYGHEACPGKGRPAPVMMQQTYGLRGCTANSWPFPDGRRYAGPPAR